MLQPLNREDNTEGRQRERSSPDAKITEPDCRVVDNLYYELCGKVGDDESEQGLEARKHTC